MLQNQVHNGRINKVYERLLAGTAVKPRRVSVCDHQVQLVETGEGPPLVLLHGTGNSSLFFQPLLKKLRSVRAIAPDRPGQGLSEPVNLPREQYRETAVEWIDELLNVLNLNITSLLGHSMGGLWALWYALAHPDRVERLVVIGAPQLPGTQAPFPFRVMATPGVGEFVQRFAPPTPKSTLQFASFVNEEETLSNRPELINLLVALGRDPTSAMTDRNEVRAILSPFGLITNSGFRHRMQVRTNELDGLEVPTLIIWGQNEPVGSVPVIKAVNDRIPHSQLELLPAGHAPWLGHPERVAELVSTFIQKKAVTGGIE